MATPRKLSLPARAGGKPGAPSTPPRTPAHADQERGGKCGDDLPGSVFNSLPVVGLGGSAGGLAALRTFFSGMPADSGMAFVVVIHLSPDHESSLAAILQHVTTMAVVQVRGVTPVEANHVYVIPRPEGFRSPGGRSTSAS